MNPITIPNISIPTIGIPTIGIPSVGFPSASGGGGLVWPAGMKEHIKAWYDPKKQGMTNYDVIEAYVEDFTNWYKEINNGTVTATNKSFHFTEVKKIGSTSAIVRLVSHRINGEIKLNIKGVTEDNPISFTEYSTTVLTVNKDGVYTLVINDATVGIYFTKVGVVDVTVTQLPTSILKDFSGNGNHAYLYGGKGKLNSGMGVYQQDFSKLIISRVDKKQDSFSFTVSGSGGSYLAYMQLGNWNNKAFKISANINAKGDYLYLRFRNSTDAVITSVMLKNGENIIPAQNIEGATKAVFEYSLKEGESITITQIPDYPDQLCYDGKMYAVAYDMPILTDYTVMAERTWFERQNRACFLSKITTSGTGAFGFEFYNEYNEDTTYSFGRVNNVKQFKDGITYQITNSYNGIVKLDYIVNGKDNAELYIGKLRLSERPAFIGCHGKIIIADRSFTEEEINWLKQNWDKI